MQDPDPKCRHFGILWHLMAFWHFMAFNGILWHFGIFAKNSNKKSNPIFPIFFPFFRLFPTFRLSDSTALILCLSGRSSLELIQILMCSLTVITVKDALLLKYVSEDNQNYLFMLLKGISLLLKHYHLLYLRFLKKGKNQNRAMPNFQTHKKQVSLPPAIPSVGPLVSILDFGKKKRFPKFGNPKAIRQQELEAFIPGNGREREFLLTPVFFTFSGPIFLASKVPVLRILSYLI